MSRFLTSAYRFSAAALPFLLGQGLIYLYVIGDANLEVVLAALAGLGVLVAIVVALADLVADPDAAWVRPVRSRGRSARD